MEGPEKCSPSTSPEKSDTLKNKFKSRAKKRKRESSGSTEDEVLPENTFEVDKNLHALAIKNNLDDISVKKILKKVVTNDHVLALVKLREEEELAETEDVQPKLTRAKAKELMKASPNSAPWNLELTPIKHIPVKTRPEVKALIAQELPDDEDDEEYQPTHEDVPSDDDHATCSDIDSQPATPATPKSQSKSSPKVVTDGPFKVPQETVSQARRQLELEEEATIALRTRSKLSLSETPIEHIESSFVPPDDIPHQDVDDLWNDFLKDCLNPASNTRHEDDDETDPEYNVAADPDAVEEDEESLENSLIKISKKELNDLVTELFNVLPEPQPSPVLTNATIEGCKNEPSNKQWEGKQEPLSDEEHRSSKACLVFERDDTLKISIGKTEPYDVQEDHCMEQAVKHTITEPVIVTMVEEHVQVEETRDPPEPPPALRSVLNVAPEPLTVEIENNAITEQQILILQQQLRMHIQLAASNFLQLFVNPVHWTYAPKYKEYIESLNSMLDKDKNSVVNVCNLKLALELITSWESSVSEDTPENKKMVEFIQGEVDKCRRRTQIHGVYVGDFPKLFKEVIACSSVFLYPYLLPPMPYRAEEVRRRPNYLPSEDQLIILGLDQFWSYVEANPEIYQRPKLCRPHHRWWLSLTIELLCKYMFPWVSTKTMAGHISAVRKTRHKQHPINKFMTSRYVEPTKHVLMPFNPELTLYEQPEGEMPRLWVRYLAKSSKRFRSYLLKKRPPSFKAPQGVEVVPGVDVSTAPKNPLPIEFAKKFTCNRINCHPAEPVVPDRVDVDIIDPLSSASLFEVVETDNGMILKPIKGPADTEVQDIPPVETVSTSQIMINPDGHCSCCSILRKICKYKQKRITEYMAKFKVKMACPCKSIKHPKITNKLKILLTYYKCRSTNIFTELQKKIVAKDTHKVNLGLSKELEDQENDARDLAFVSKFLIRLAMREGKARNQQIKRSLFTTLSRFQPDEGDPLQLMENIYNACEVDLADMYKEFVGFLNPEQAEKIDKFRDYFIHNCMEDLIKKIEESVTDRKRKTSILQYLMSLARKNPSSCVLCTELLNRMRDYPQLARYCFSLFPHRRKVNIQTSSIKTVDLTKTPKKKAVISQTTNRNNPTSYVKIQPKPSESMECVNDVISNQNVIKVITCNVGNESQDTAHSDNVKSNQDCIHSQKHRVVSKQDSVQLQEGSVVSNQDNVQLQKDSVISKQDNVQSQADNVISNPNNVESQEDSVASKQDSVQSQADSVVFNQDNIQSQENSVVSSQDNAQLQKCSVISKQDNVQSQEDSVISNQDNVQSQENSVVSDQDNVQIQKGSVISKQDNLQSQEDSVVSNQANVALADNVVSDQDNVQSQGDSVVSNQDNVQSLTDNVVSNQDNVQSQGESVISNPDNVQSQGDSVVSNQDNVQSLRVDVISNQDNVQSQGGSVISYHDTIELQELDDDIDDDTEHEGMLRICEDTNTDNVIYIISSDDDSEDTTQIKNMNRQLESTNKMPIPKVEIEEDTKISKILIEADCSPESEPEDMDISDSVPPSDCEDEEIEWKREEDKLILEVLQQHLTPEERNDKTIIERIEEKDIPQIIANSLKYKTLRGIRDRIYYLLQILVLNELNDD